MCALLKNNVQESVDETTMESKRKCIALTKFPYVLHTSTIRAESSSAIDEKEPNSSLLGDMVFRYS